MRFPILGATMLVLATSSRDRLPLLAGRFADGTMRSEDRNPGYIRSLNSGKTNSARNMSHLPDWGTQDGFDEHLASAINYMATGSYVNSSVLRSRAEWECMVVAWTCVTQNPLVIHPPAK